MVLLAAGLGVGAAVGFSRLLAALLFGVRALDPISYGAAVVIVLFGAAAGAWLPLRRATLLDPNDALRRE